MLTHEELLKLPQAQPQELKNPYEVRYAGGWYHIEYVRPKDGHRFPVTLFGESRWADKNMAEKAAEGAFWRWQRLQNLGVRYD